MMSALTPCSTATGQAPAARPTVFLARHATPDWSRRDIRYDIPPGPPLTAAGEEEAAKLGEFLRDAGVVRVYASPLERTKRTAEIAAVVAGVPVTILEELAEWRHGESTDEVLKRIHPCWTAAHAEAGAAGSVALVTHGGPIHILLQHLGASHDQVEHYRRQFDHQNPVPPAGVWSTTPGSDDAWELSLVFTPSPCQPYIV